MINKTLRDDYLSVFNILRRVQMTKLGTSKDLAGLKLELPTEVKMELQHVLELLDEAYGRTRDVDKDLGGYTLIIENDKDVDKCIKFGITFDDTSIPEYVLLIKPNKGEPYTESLFLANDDYSIVTFIPLRLTPQYLINMMEQ